MRCGKMEWITITRKMKICKHPSYDVSCESPISVCWCSECGKELTEEEIEEINKEK